jgi:hypothetical protein
MFRNDLDTALFAEQMNNDVIPYNQRGINLLGAIVNNICKRYEDNELFRNYNVNIPKLEEINPADVTARDLKYIEGEAVLAGAIHDVYVKFNITT